MEWGSANIQYVKTCSTVFAEHKCILLHETFTFIYKDMTKDLGVPFVPSKTELS